MISLIVPQIAVAKGSAQVKFALVQGADCVQVTVSVECRAGPHELPFKMTVVLHSSYRAAGGFVEFAADSREVCGGGDLASVVFVVPSMGDGGYKFRAVVYDDSGAVIALGTIEPKMTW